MKRIVQQYRLILDSSQIHRVLLFFVCILVGGLLETLSISMIFPLILTILDMSFWEQNLIIQRVFLAFHIHNQKQMIIFFMLLLCVAFLLKNLFVYLTQIYQRQFIVKGSYETSLKLFNIYLHCDYEELLSKNSNDIIANISSLVSKIYVLLEAFLNLLSELIVAVSMVLFMFYINWGVTALFAVLMFSLLLLYQKVLKKKIRQNGKLSNEYYLKGLSSVNEAMAGIKEIQLMNREKYFYNIFKDNGYKNVCLEKKQKKYTAAPAHITEITVIGGMAIYIISTVMLKDNLSMLIAQISVIALVAIRLIASSNRINLYMNNISYYRPSLDKITDDFLKYLKETGSYKFDEVKPICFEKEIQFDHVSYCYPNTERYVVKDISFTIKKGQKVGIVGKSGVGKTTIADLLLGYLKPSEGCIRVDGTDIQENWKGWASLIGYIPQMIFMLDDTIQNNIVFGSDIISEQSVKEAIDKAQLSEFIASLPDGLNTRIGERGIRLSGGQRQRIGIARALYCDPQVLVLDEATSSLDRDTEREVMKSAYKAANDRTMIIISHNMQTLHGCDVIFQIDTMGISDITKDVKEREGI